MIRNVGNFTIITKYDNVTSKNENRQSFTISMGDVVFKTDNLRLSYLTSMVFIYSIDEDLIFKELCRLNKYANGAILELRDLIIKYFTFKICEVCKEENMK